MFPGGGGHLGQEGQASEEWPHRVSHVIHPYGTPCTQLFVSQAEQEWDSTALNSDICSPSAGLKTRMGTATEVVRGSQTHLL